MKLLSRINDQYHNNLKRIGEKLSRNHKKNALTEMKEKHVACVFLLDVSESMNYPKEHRPIDSLNMGLQVFKEQVCCEKTNRDNIDISVVTFGTSAKVVSPFRPAIDFIPPVLEAEGCTALGSGLSLAIRQAEKQIEWYKKEGLEAETPWVVLVTDGVPTDSVIQVKRQMDASIVSHDTDQIKLWIVASENADLRFCKCLTKRVIWLEDQDYRPIFDWMRKSMGVLSKGKAAVGHAVLPKLPENTRYIPQDW